jgi:hypothetical protein
MGPTAAPFFSTTNAGQVLIRGARVLGRKRLDGGVGRGERRALPCTCAFPAALDDAPVGLVAVHVTTMRPPTEADFLCPAHLAQLGLHRSM